jgi:hypothetical protein
LGFWTAPRGAGVLLQPASSRTHAIQPNRFT